jgi:hypothetical protein
LSKSLLLKLGFGLIRFIVGFLPQFLGTITENARSIGFAKEEETGHLDYAVGDRSRVEDPAPGSILRNETAGDRAQGWAEEGGQAINRDTFTTFFRTEAIG